MQILNDFSTSVDKALTEIDPLFMQYPGFVICGTHTPEPEFAEFLIDTITQCRISGTPYLGICFGHQLAAIEWARYNGIPDATSEEFGEGTPVVVKRPSLKVGQHDGETYWNWYEVSIEWNKPPHFFTAQYHPEYQSDPDKPHPLLVEFLDHARMAM
jgi:CTP synthase (UTP-ammonia lyase)